MCTTCGCGAGETRIDGQAVPPEHADDPHWHVHADGTGHSHDHAADGHAHEHGGDHAHAHTHPHRHDDGTVHVHPHDHQGEHHHTHHAAHHEHEHSHADGTTHVHGHTHDDTGFHDHPHAHDHVHPVAAHGHEVTHGHVHQHADGSIHSHAHDHGGEHHHHHHSAEHEHEHRHADGSVHSHAHSHADTRFHDHPAAHDHAHAPAGTLDYGSGAARSHAPGMTQARMVQIERDILSKNDGYAAKNRQVLADRGIFALNFVSSPGSGKTTLLVRTIEALKARHSIAVIEGDQQTANDADRIRATGAPALQINTGKGCHLDAHMVGHALGKLPLRDDSFLFIENVGNLVCPAAFDLGEAAKVAILSVTEGEDKPLKYPDMFAAAKLMLLNKVDLLPHVSFKVDLAIESALRVNPRLEIIQVSATSGAGFDTWLAWLEVGLSMARNVREQSTEALRRRVAELEARLAAQGGAPDAARP